MTLNLTLPGQEDLRPRITVFGVGGAGGNAVNNMIDKNLEGVDFVVANTDAQALQQSAAQSRVQLGVKVTEGLGAGARAAVGAAAAEESIDQIIDHLAGAHMCFITAGMGGGTGTGAAPIIAHAARELGVLTVGVVTKPFQFEGNKRMKQAEDGVEALQKVVDTLIIIPNQNLFRLANEKTTFTEAFSLADDVLYQGVKGVTDLMVRPGLINLDFADVRAVMDEMGKAMMGTGEAEGEDRAVQAADKAIANPLLDEISLKGAKGVLINITGGHDLTLFELDEAANRIREEVDQNANIIVGSTLDESLGGMMRVSVVATGIDAAESHAETPLPRRSLTQPNSTKPYNGPATPIPAPAAKVEEVEPAFVPEPAPEPAFVEAHFEEPVAAQHQEPEPSLFQGIDVDRNSAPEQMETIFEDEQVLDDDGLPPPAYQPAVSEFRPQPDTIEADPQDFVAPRSGAVAGAPNPDMVARVKAAAARGREAQPQPEVEAEKPRFSVNSLIGRMTGHGQQAAAPEAAPAARRQQPPVQAQQRPAPAPMPEAEPEDDRIEIPAFLRRQAN